MNSIGQEFMSKTRYRFMGESEQQRGAPQPPVELPVDSAKPAIALPKAETLPLEPVLLRELIEQRRSIRDYASSPLSLPELSYLLWCTQGVRDATPPRTSRNVPSAGARHAFETFLLINHVAGVPAGLYRYHATAHRLIEERRGEGLGAEFSAACLGQDFVAGSAVTFIWAAVARRMTWRYSERGYRYLHLDAGHVCQNLYLAAESIGCGVCAIAAYDDDLLNRALQLDGREEFAIYLAPIGKKKSG